MATAARGHRAAQRHWEVLTLSLLALVAAPLLDVRPDQRVAARGLPQLVLPPTCLMREAFHLDCPGCGLTRSFVHLAHGDWQASLHCHRLGWLLMTVAAIQLPYRAHLLWGSGRFAMSKPVANAIATALIGLLIANWCLKVGVFLISCAFTMRVVAFTAAASGAMDRWL